MFVSCYASVKNHHWAQIFMTPFHWYYRLARVISVNEPFDNNRADGIHSVFYIIYQLTTYIQYLILPIF